MNTIYWYDYETSGTDPARDRPLQFAGLRTDENLEIVGEPLMLYCRPAGDFVPHPEAALVTGITPQHALEHGVPEAEFIARILAEFSTPDTCVAGYNSLRFDDEFTRYTLYRNFFDPYAREYRDGNSRWDLIDVVRLARLLRPDGIQWPDHADGKPSFRLEDLTAANGIGHQDAHDALADVRATIAVAALLRERQPELYRQCHALRRKQNVAALIDLQRRKPFLHVSRMFPAERGCASLVMPLMAHPNNRNSVIVYDLRADPTDLLRLDGEEIARRVFTRQEDLGEGETRIPLKELRTNRCPIVVDVEEIDGAVAARMQIDMDQCRRHWKMIHDAQGLESRLKAVFMRQFSRPDDPDLRLYGEFSPPGDQRLMEAVRSSSPADLRADRWHFVDGRLRALLPRYKARNWPDALDAGEREDWEAFRRHRLTDPDGGASITVQACLARIAELERDGLSPDQAGILGALREYAGSILDAGGGG